MKRFSSREIMRRAVLGAAVGASNHVMWTGGKGIPWHSPEYLLTVHALRSIWRYKAPVILFCEAHARDAIYQSGGTLKGRYPKIFGESSRADIIVYNRQLVPKGVIEVKRGVWNTGRIVKDAKRLAYGLRKEGTIGFGIMLFTTGCLAHKSGGREGLLAQRLPKWTASPDSQLAPVCKNDIKMQYLCSPIRSWYGHGPSGIRTYDWQAAAIMLTRRRNS